MLRRIIYSIVALTLVLAFWSPSVWAWCWLRDGGYYGRITCQSGGYQTICCDTALRRWANATMTYQISTSTSDARAADIREGAGKWNAIEMSTFTFVEGARTAVSGHLYDGINVINIDADFCAHNPSDCNIGVLGFSGCYTTGSGDSYRVLDCDVVLNGEEYSWSSALTVAVIAHEVGHDAGLSHAGSVCRSSGSSGCGPEFDGATMYYSIGGEGDKTNLELDDVAAMVYGYPRSTVRVRVVDGSGAAIQGASVELLNTAAPVNGEDEFDGGSVKGDIANSYFGDGISSPTYIDATPFTVTDSTGYTNYIKPVHASFQVMVSKSGYPSKTQSVTPAAGTSTVTVQLGETQSVPSAPVATTLIAPTGSVEDTTPTYTWNTVASSTWYYLWINNSSGTAILKQWYRASEVQNGSICSATPALTLGPGTYRWWIQTWSSAGTGPWSSAMSFTVSSAQFGAATLVSPSGAGKPNSPVFTWNTVSGSTWYQLWIDNSQGAVFAKWYTTPQVLHGATCSIVPTISLADGNYTWRVRTYKPGLYGPWSQTMSFTVQGSKPATATLVAPTGSVSTTSPTYNWNTVDGSTWYYLWVNGPSGKLFTQWFPVGAVFQGDVCSAVAATNLPGSGKYTWWIQTWNSRGYGAWSSPKTFIVP